MQSKQLIKIVKINDMECKLYLQTEKPFVEIDKQIYPFFYHLAQAVSLLSHVDNIHAFVEISNFFWKSGCFCELLTVESIQEYQHFYQERVNYEKENSAITHEYRLTDFKIFDVSEMHPPKVIHDSLYYYVYDKKSYLPYRVVTPFPYHLNQAVHYQILPLHI